MSALSWSTTGATTANNNSNSNCEESTMMNRHENVDSEQARCGGRNDDNNTRICTKEIDLTGDFDDSSDEEAAFSKGSYKVVSSGGSGRIVPDEAVSCDPKQQADSDSCISPKSGLVIDSAASGENVAPSTDAAEKSIQNTGLDDKCAETDTEQLQLQMDITEKDKTVENGDSSRDTKSKGDPVVSVQEMRKHYRKITKILNKIHKSVPFLKQLLDTIERDSKTSDRYRFGLKEFAVDIGEVYGLGSIGSDTINAEKVQISHLLKLREIFKKYDKSVEGVLFEASVDAYCKAAGVDPNELRRKINQPAFPTAIDDHNEQKSAIEDTQNAASKSHMQWKSKFDQLMGYKRDHGDFDIPSQSKVEGRTVVNPLYTWVRAQRNNFKAGKKITPEQISMLGRAGFEWDPPKRKRGRNTADVIQTPVNPKMEKKQPSADEKWEAKFQELRQFKDENGDWDAPKGPLPIPLQNWISKQRNEYVLFIEGKSSTLTNERISLLEGEGFVWQQNKPKKYSREDEAWHECFRKLQEYIKEYNDMKVEFSEDPTLFKWIKNQREQRKLKDECKRSSMTEQRLNLLNNIGFQWEREPLTPEKEYTRERKIRPTADKLPAAEVKKLNDEYVSKKLKELKKYQEKYGDMNVKIANDKGLYNWVTSIRVEYRNKTEGKPTRLTDAQIRMFNNACFIWQGVRSKKNNDQPIPDLSAKKLPGKRKVCVLDNAESDNNNFVTQDAAKNFFSQNVAKYFVHTDGSRVLYLGIVVSCDNQNGRRVYTVKYTDDTTEEVGEEEVESMIELFSQAGKRNKRCKQAVDGAVRDQVNVATSSASNGTNVGNNTNIDEIPSVVTSCGVGIQTDQAGLDDNELSELRQEVRKLRKDCKRFETRIGNVSSELRQVSSTLHGVRAMMALLLQHNDIHPPDVGTQEETNDADMTSTF